MSESEITNAEISTEIEERLRQLSPTQLLELVQGLSRSDSAFTDETRQVLHNVTLSLKEEIRQDEKLFREKSGQLIRLLNQMRADDTLTDEFRQELDELASMIAGASFSYWLPRGKTRKFFMFLSLAIGVLGTIQWSGWFALFIVFAVMFSPRILGEVLFFIGSVRKMGD
jgi:hypothetical protein